MNITHAGFLGSLTLFLLVYGCVPKANVDTRDMLFDANGREYDKPSVKLWRRFMDADRKGRHALLARIAAIVDKEAGAYSRLVAAEELLGSLATAADEGNMEYFTEEIVNVIAKKLIKVAEEPKRSTTIMDRSLRANSLGEAFFFLIDPRCEIWVDGKTMLLVDGLPRGWVGENGSVTIDGILAAEHEGVYEPERGRPCESVVLTDFIKPPNFYGKHTIVSKLTVIAPNGMKVPLKRELEIEVVTPERFGIGTRPALPPDPRPYKGDE
jgi:hypothetical protein